MKAALEAAPLSMLGESLSELDLRRPGEIDPSSGEQPSGAESTAARASAAASGILCVVEPEMAEPEAVHPGTLPGDGLPPEPAAPNEADYAGVLVLCGLVLCLSASAILSQPDVLSAIVVGGFSLIVLALAAGRYVQHRQDVAAHAAAKLTWDATVRRLLAERGAAASSQAPDGGAREDAADENSRR